MPEFLHYQVMHKNRPWGRAITDGFRARVARPGEAILGRGYTHIIAGLQFGSLETLKAVRSSGEPYLFVDRAYFGGGAKSGRMRITYGAYQQHWIASKPVARDWGVELQPWREGGEFVMVVPPSPEVESLFGVHWERDHMPRIRAAVAHRKMVVSPKSDRDVSPLSERLRGCAGVVTWSSNVAVEAICAGVPAWTSTESAAAPVSADLLKVQAGMPINPARVDREAWFRSLCWAQFTIDEVGSGFARDVLMSGVEECATT